MDQQERWRQDATAVLDVLFPSPEEFEGYVCDAHPNTQIRFTSGMDRAQQYNLLLTGVDAEKLVVGLSTTAASHADGTPARRVRETLPRLLGCKRLTPAGVLRALAEVGQQLGEPLAAAIAAADALHQPDRRSTTADFAILANWVRDEHNGACLPAPVYTSPHLVPLAESPALVLCWYAVRRLVYESPWTVDPTELSWCLLLLIERIHPLNWQLPCERNPWQEQAVEVVNTALNQSLQQESIPKQARLPLLKALQYLLRQYDLFPEISILSENETLLSGADAADSDPYLKVALSIGRYCLYKAQGRDLQAQELMTQVHQTLSAPHLEKDGRWLSLALRFLLQSDDPDQLMRVAELALSIGEGATEEGAYFRLAAVHSEMGDVQQSREFAGRSGKLAGARGDERGSARAELLDAEILLSGNQQVEPHVLERLLDRFRPGGAVQDEYYFARTQLAHAHSRLHQSGALTLADLPRIRFELEMALAHFENREYRQDAMQAQRLLGQSYLKQGELLAKQKQYSRAAETFRHAIAALGKASIPGVLVLTQRHGTALAADLELATRGYRRADAERRLAELAREATTPDVLLDGISVLLETAQAEEEAWWKDWSRELWERFYELASGHRDQTGLQFYSDSFSVAADGLSDLRVFLSAPQILDGD